MVWPSFALTWQVWPKVGLFRLRAIYSSQERQLQSELNDKIRIRAYIKFTTRPTTLLKKIHGSAGENIVNLIYARIRILF